LGTKGLKRRSRREGVGSESEEKEARPSFSFLFFIPKEKKPFIFYFL
jgi:hypothetical protein